MARFLLAAAVVLLGCSSPPPGSCDVATTASIGYTYCIDYLGSGYSADTVKAACAANESTYSPDRCAAGTDGVCTFNAGTDQQFTHQYSLSADGTDGGIVDLQSICEDAGGTFSSM